MLVCAKHTQPAPIFSRYATFCSISLFRYFLILKMIKTTITIITISMFICSCKSDNKSNSSWRTKKYRYRLETNTIQKTKDTIRAWIEFTPLPDCLELERKKWVNSNIKYRNFAGFKTQFAFYCVNKTYSSLKLIIFDTNGNIIEKSNISMGQIEIKQGTVYEKVLDYVCK